MAAHAHDPKVLDDDVAWPDNKPPPDPLAEVKWPRQAAEGQEDAAEGQEDAKQAGGLLGSFASQSHQAAGHPDGGAEEWNESMRKIRATVAGGAQTFHSAEKAEDQERPWRVSIAPPQPAPDKEVQIEQGAGAGEKKEYGWPDDSGDGKQGAQVGTWPAGALDGDAATTAWAGQWRLQWSSALWFAAVLLCFVLGWAAGVNMRHILSGEHPPLMTPKPREDSLDDEPPCAHEPRDTYAQAPWAGGAGADAATAGDGRSARGILVPPQTSSRRPSLQSVRSGGNEGGSRGGTPRSDVAAALPPSHPTHQYV